MEDEFSFLNISPFAFSVATVVAGTFFLIVYDILRWWKERKRKQKLLVMPSKQNISKLVTTLRGHKEVLVLHIEMCCISFLLAYKILEA